MKRATLIFSWLMLFTMLLSSCESLGEDAAAALAGALTSGVQINVDADLGDDTLARIDNINNTLNSGIEVGPETRKTIEELNQTLANGIKAGFDDATLARIDQLLSIIEQGLHVEVGLDNKTLSSVNRLLDQLDQAPDRWQNVAEDLIKTLEGSSTNVAKEMANQVKSVLSEARLNLQQLMAAAGTEMRCNVDFMGSRAGATLTEFMGQSIIGTLHNIIEGKTGADSKPPAIPWVCQIIPDQVQLKSSGSKLLAEKPVIILTGYNFSDVNNPQVILANDSGQPVGGLKLYAYRQSSYQIQLNLQEIDFSTLPARSRVVFKWPNVTDTTALALLRPEAGITPTVSAEVTMTAKTNIYAGPGVKYTVLSLADKGAKYPLTGRNGDSSWWQILFDKKTGWVPATAATKNALDVPVVTLPLPPPTANFKASPTMGANPLSVAFTDLSTNNPTKWKWDFGDGTTSTEQNPTHKYTKLGQQTVTLTASNNLGSDTKTINKYITVTSPPPGPVAVFHVTQRNGSAPFSVKFINNSTGSPTTYTWNFGDNKSSTEREPTHLYNSPGVYTVSLKVKNAQGEHTLTLSDYITVGNPPNLPACYGINTSDEYGAVSCQQGFAVVAVGCQGTLCDNITMTCCPYMAGPDSDVTFSWTPYLKSGTSNYSFFSQWGFLAGLQARGTYSAELSLKFWNSKNFKPILNTCQKLELFSEETPLASSGCGQGSFVAGLECWGEACDSMRLTCCQGGK